MSLHEKEARPGIPDDFVFSLMEEMRCICLHHNVCCPCLWLGNMERLKPSGTRCEASGTSKSYDGQGSLLGPEPAEDTKTEVCRSQGQG